MKQAYKTLAMAHRIATYAVYGSSLYYWHKNHDRRLRALLDNLQAQSQKTLDVLNIQVDTHYRTQADLNKNNYLVLSNHMSYVDALVLASVFPSIFITSIEVRDDVFLGTLSKVGGCFFVERRNREKLHKEIDEIAGLLSRGFNVCIFPEGTTSNGQDILPFKRSLLTTAVRSETQILPVCIRYKTIDGEPFSEKNADSICWYGKMPFFPHLKTLLSTDSIQAELNFLDPIDVQADSNRRELADRTRHAIVDTYTQV